MIEQHNKLKKNVEHGPPPKPGVTSGAHEW